MSTTGVAIRDLAPGEIGRAGKALMLLLFAGLLTFAAVRTHQEDDRDEDPCKPFTIGKSAIGSCDWLLGYGSAFPWGNLDRAIGGLPTTEH